MPTLEQLERDLPNGFHDTKLCHLEVNYERGEVVMTMDVDASDPDATKKPQYRRGQLQINGMAFFSMDVPDSVSDAKPLWIDAGPGQPSKSVVVLPEVPPDCFLHWFFVNEWNGFIRVAARDAAFKWADHPAGSEET
jgi:hypothetical protein